MESKKTLVFVLGMDLLGLAAFLIAQQIVTRRPGAYNIGKGFWSEPVPAGLMVLAALSFILAGLISFLQLWRKPLESSTARWGWRLAKTYMMIILIISCVAAIKEISEAVAQWLELVVISLGLVSIGLGISSKEPSRKGFFFGPLFLGVLVLVFSLGELTSNH